MQHSYAFLGPAGTFAQQALQSIPEAANGKLIACSGIPAVAAAVRDAQADFGLMPMENSVEGPVSTTTDELVLNSPLQIMREVFLPVSFVVATRGDGLEKVTTLASHPHAHAQVRSWRAEHLPSAHVVPAGSTAEAASLVAQGEYDAAVCARIAAENNGLTVIAEKVEDTGDAVTRFVLVAKPGAPPPMTGNDRTSIVVHIKQEQPGALSGVLVELASRSINLTRIESRPWRERHAEYHFILEFEGHVADPRVGEALAALHRVCADVRFLGSYPRADRANEQLPAYASDQAFAAAAQWVERVRRGGESL